MRHWLGGFVGLVLLACPLMAHAADGEMVAGEGKAKMTWSFTKDYTVSPWVHEVGYTRRAWHKLGFGLKNLFLGWTDLFTEPSKTRDAGKSVWAGIGRGLKDLVENELGGAVHTITFPITALDAPLPDGGVQLD